MAFGSKKEAVTAKPSFQERLTGVKSMFKKAREDASKLSTEMQSEMDKKNSQIQLISAEIEQIKTVQDETVQFMSNLEKFI